MKKFNIKNKNHLISYILENHESLKNIKEDEYFILKDFLWSEYYQMSYDKVLKEYQTIGLDKLCGSITGVINSINREV
jgi:hypothetical protein